MLGLSAFQALRLAVSTTRHVGDYAREVKQRMGQRLQHLHQHVLQR